MKSRLLPLVAFGLTACSDSPAPPPAEPTTFFVDRTPGSGIDFVHHHGGAGKKLLVEINAGCVAMIDYDSDGDLDLYFGQGHALPGYLDESTDFRDRLYRNDGDFRFTDVTDETGVSEDGYTYHASAVDYDGDGDQDLYLSNFAANRMLRNDGGKFVDVTAEVGAATDRWSTTSCFADFDQDGDLDLYVTNYVIYPLDHSGCGSMSRGEGWRAYCAPDEFPGSQDLLYRNDAGRFVDITEEAGMIPGDGSGLGLVPTDYDDDGDLDLFVANDGRPNHFWRNEGDMRFTDQAWNSGVAVGSHGTSEACMGTDFGDIDGDGDFDLLVANLAVETNTLFRNEGNGLFDDQSVSTGLGPPSRRFVGFGCEFFDFDNDGDVDNFVANGHVIDNIHLYEPSQTFRQVPHLYVNDGSGRFTERGEEFCQYFEGQYVGRGVATGDLDNDGDLDVVIAHNNAAPAILENQRGNEKSWIGFKLRGRGFNSAALGARVEIECAGKTQREEVRGTSSYAAFHDLRVHFGLDQADRVERVQIRWPMGSTQTLRDLAAGQYHVIEEASP